MKDSTHLLRAALVGFLFTLSLAACAPASGTKLSDETSNEPTPSSPVENSPMPTVDVPPSSPSAQDAILQKYASVDPGHVVPTDLLKAAILFYDANPGKIVNRAYLTVVDFSRRSNLHRFFVVNMSTGIVWALPVAHGKGSDLNGDGYADVFSNKPGSEQSSLGYYVTAEPYNGEHGLSLRLDGLSATNSNVRSRAIVVHGASYVQDKNVIQGRSWGCFAVPIPVHEQVVNTLKNGTLIYAGIAGK